MTITESFFTFLGDVKKRMPLTYSYLGKRWSGRSYGNLNATVELIHQARQALLASGKYVSLAEIARAEEEVMLTHGRQGNEAPFLTDMLADGMRQQRTGRRILYKR